MSNPRKYYLPVVLPSTPVDDEFYAGAIKTPEWEEWPTLGEIRETVKQLRESGYDTPYSGVDNHAYETGEETGEDEDSGAEDGTLDTPKKSVF